MAKSLPKGIWRGGTDNDSLLVEDDYDTDRPFAAIE